MVSVERSTTWPEKGSRWNIQSKAVSISSSGTFHATSAPSARLVASSVCRTRRIVPAHNMAAMRVITTSTSTPERRAIASNGSRTKPSILSSEIARIFALIGSSCSIVSIWLLISPPPPKLSNLMAHYPDSLSLLNARALFFQDAKLGPNGGYGDRWVRVESKPIPFYFPNLPSRVAAARLHDLHHIAAEYETDWPGEAEIAAWEIASGCARYHAAWVLNFGGFGAGLVVAPRRLFHAFLRGRRAKTNLYKSCFDESRLNDITLGMLRDQLGLRAALPSANTADVGLFLLWCIPSVLAWLPLPFLTLILFWLIVRSKF